MTSGFTPMPQIPATPSTDEVLESVRQATKMIRLAECAAIHGSPEHRELQIKRAEREIMLKQLEDQFEMDPSTLFAGPDGAAEKKVLMRRCDDELQVAYRFLPDSVRPVQPFAMQSVSKPAMVYVGPPGLDQHAFTPENIPIHTAGNTPNVSGRHTPKTQVAASSNATRLSKIDAETMEILKSKKEKLLLSPPRVGSVASASDKTGKEMIQNLERVRKELEDQVNACLLYTSPSPRDS